ncbi:MAG: hypothetical protein LWW94_11050 [Candidatus Desulfofervidaceae bacterium]|nr:hypothetical protein [Candidatus Desulfofervidaceae bacterium]
MNNLIEKLNKIGQDYFFESEFRLIQKSSISFVINGNYISTAVNNYNNESHKVNVLKWFDDFWIYIEIKFIPKPHAKRKKQLPNIFFTLSVFQGSESDDVKTQLFRAEWDNYEDLSDIHPQPHWHIFPYKYSHQIHNDFEEFISLTKEDNDFNSLLNNKRVYEIIDLKKFHFAMNGQWSENKTDVHKIQIEENLLNWFNGVLNHIKKELEYVNEK